MSLPLPFTAIEWNGVVKDFDVGLRGRRLRALDHLSLRVKTGSVMGLLGPNGSGKSTALKLVLGLLEPGAGSCRILGQPSTLPSARVQLGYLTESPAFPPRLTGREVVRLHGRLAGLAGARLEARVVDVLDLLRLLPAADRPVEGYSKGMCQRLGLAQALVHDPAILILDEPTAGVDPVGCAGIADAIRRLRDCGKTVLLTSHQLDQVEALCESVAILDRGRLVLHATLAELGINAGPARPSRRPSLERIYLEQFLAPADS